MMKHIMIVPCATTRTDVEFAYDTEMCCINCVRAISEIDINSIDEIYFVILADILQSGRLARKADEEDLLTFFKTLVDFVIDVAGIALNIFRAGKLLCPFKIVG